MPRQYSELCRNKNRRFICHGIYILPTATMPTENLITYLPTYDKTILYVYGGLFVSET